MNLEWMLRLRWAAIAGGAVCAGVGDWLLDGRLPLLWIGAVFALQIAVQFLVHRLLTGRASRWTEGDWQRLGPRLVVLSLLADVAALTAILALSGGPSNPFTTVYLVHVALASVVLPGRPAALLAVVMVLSYLGLFFVAPELPAGAALPTGGVPALPDHVVEVHGPSWTFAPSRAPRSERPVFSAHAWGMLVAFAGSAFLLVAFVSRVGLALRRRDAQLHLERRRREAAERVQSMATLAAGAAHELASPLSTIAVVAAELAASVERDTFDRGSLRADIGLIRDEVGACRQVLDELAFGTGQVRAHAPERLPLPEFLVDVATHGTWALDGVRVRAEGIDHLWAEPSGLRRSLRNLLRNAFAAGAQQVDLEAVALPDDGDEGPHLVEISVTDDGRGMDSETQERSAEPFFTTAEPGRGMGLGLFLVQRFAEQAGGEMHITSTPGAGTRVSLVLPCLGVGGACTPRVQEPGGPT